MSLAGNVSLLSPVEVLSACYPHFMAYLKGTVSSTEQYHGLASIHISKLKVLITNFFSNIVLKGKCLEAAALLGRAVGLEVFHTDAEELMNWICSAHQAVLIFIFRT